MDLLLFSYRGRPRFKNLAQANDLVAEVREVLRAYFDYPSPSPQPGKDRVSCEHCSVAARFWCVDCDAQLCRNCAARRHHPGTKAVTHSVEEMLPLESQGARLFTPIVPEVVLWICVYYLVSNLELGPGYMSRYNMCPIVDLTRMGLAAVDTKVLYYLKAQLVNYCGIEDSFYKLFLDGWVRNVATNSDDTLLLVSTLFHALLFETVVVMLIVVPILSAVFTVLLRFFYYVERSLPRTPTLRKLEGHVALLEGFSILWNRNVAPPLTKLRKRPSEDMFEELIYRRRRATRILSFYYQTTRQGIQDLVRTLRYNVIIFRLVCIWSMNIFSVGLGDIIRGLLSFFGLSPLLQQQKTWFEAHATNVLNDRWLLNHIPQVLGATSKIVRRTSYFPFRGVFAGFLLLAVIVLVLIIRELVSQRRNFNDDWTSWAMEDCVGTCSQENCPCAACQGHAFNPEGTIGGFDDGARSAVDDGGDHVEEEVEADEESDGDSDFKENSPAVAG